jgi:hypothetical protein
MKTTLLICVSLLLAAASKAQVSGPNSANSFTTSSIPGFNQSWINSENTGASDDIYSSFGNLTGSTGSYTDYLVATHFNLNVPAGMTIKGIVVTVECSDPNDRTSDYSVRIVKASTIGTTERANGKPYPVTDDLMTYGDVSDRWGETWTVAEINDNNFGVAISAMRNADDGITAGQIDNIQITVYYSFITLPVTLNSFMVAKENKTVLVNWNTDDEISMDHYEVERSADGRNFSSLTTIACSNQTSASYSFHDISPLAGTSYYRLRMKELSGQSKYSKVVQINFNKYSLISLSPSPAARGSMLNINNPAQRGFQYPVLFGKRAGDRESNYQNGPGDLACSLRYKGYHLL